MSRRPGRREYVRMPVVSFRAKVAMLLSGVILVLGVVAVTQARNDMRRILGSELERRGEAIAKDLAANSVDMVLTGDLVGLHELVNRTKVNNTDVRYLLVLGSNGVILANTFGASIPRGLLDANAPSPGQPVQLKRLHTEEGLVRDIAAPILEGRGGVVRVGMSSKDIDAAVVRNTRGLAVLVLVAAGVGLLASYWLSGYLTRPLSRLVAAVQSVTRGDLSQRIEAPSCDEVGRLGHAFNVMARELAAKEAARRELLDKVISSQEEERKRLAREMHDELAQQLTSVLLSLDAVQRRLNGSDTVSQQTIQRAAQATARSLAETRKLIADLRPTVLDDLGLVPAIRSYAQDRLGAAGTEVSITADGLPDSLPPAVETAVFRIVQEAVSNAAKHARARRAWITLRLDGNALVGEVRDDGQGFRLSAHGAAPGTDGHGLGLRGMEERAALLGGSLSVSSQMGAGTVVRFSVPLEEADGRV